MARHKGHKLARRYGHSHRRYGHSAALDAVKATPGAVRKLMQEHPVITSAAIGGTAVALAAGLTGEAAILAGAAAGIAIHKATEKKHAA